MVALDHVLATPGKMEERKEVRMHRADRARIRAAATALGMKEADFIRQAALLYARDVEKRMASPSLSKEDFQAFKAAVEAPREGSPGMVLAVKTVQDVPKDWSYECVRKDYAGQ